MVFRRRIACIWFLYGVSATDFPTLLAVILLVLIVATASSLLPSLRASRVEPMQVLREE